MTTLYVVTCRCNGEDPHDHDRHIMAIFSTREGAERWIAPAAHEMTSDPMPSDGPEGGVKCRYLVEERTLDDPHAADPLDYHAHEWAGGHKVP